jgi:DNA (cytosine-5)-methyltransferase 1
MKALELFCGIGGFAAAVAGSGVKIVGALDHDPTAIAIHRLNFPEHGALKKDLERITVAELAAYGADLWWLSPPCQPYSLRGARRDLNDPRARSLVRLMDLLAGFPDTLLPQYIALENVEGFAQSQARERLFAILTSRGYHLHERRLCPTELGVPSRRPRYYLAASRIPFTPPSAKVPLELRPLKGYLEPFPPQGSPRTLCFPEKIVERFGSGLRIIDADDQGSYTTCFTSGYGRSIMRAGSYLRCGEGVRYFAPEEIARLLHFPVDFRFPEGMRLRRKWHFLGNSLSVIAVREVLGTFRGTIPLR